jgi:hypothetical protein
MQLVLKSLVIIDESNPRFPNIVETLDNHRQALIEIMVEKKDKTSPSFKGIEMEVHLTFGNL